MTRLVIPELPAFDRFRNPIPLWLEEAHSEANDHRLLISDLGCGYCIYCGDPAEAGDHLVPEPMSGPIYRVLVPIVPACTPCNSILGAFPSPIVRSRSAFIAHRLMIRHKVNYETWAWLEGPELMDIPDDVWVPWTNLTHRLDRLLAGGVLHAFRSGVHCLPDPMLRYRPERYVR